MQISDDTILQFLQEQGIIDLSDVQEVMRQKERERLLSRHKNAIFLDEKDGRWKTTLPDLTKKSKRRLIAKKNRRDLEDVVIDYYIKQDQPVKNVHTLESLYPQWFKYKSVISSTSSYMKRISCDWIRYYVNDPIINTPIEELDYITLCEWAYNLIRRNALTRKQYYNVTVIIRQCLDYAVDKGWLKSNEFDRIKIKRNVFAPIPKKDSRTQVFLETEQELLHQEALRCIKNNEAYLVPYLILLNFQIGLRVGELVAIKWSDIEGDSLHVQRMEQSMFEGNCISMSRSGIAVTEHTKTLAGDRLVFLNESARNILTEIKRVSDKYALYDNDFVCVSSKTGMRLAAKTFNSCLSRMCHKCGIAVRGNHKIRKTRISTLFDSGININTIREQAGHADEKTTLNSYLFDQKDDETKRQQLETAVNKKMTI